MPSQPTPCPPGLSLDIYALLKLKVPPLHSLLVMHHTGQPSPDPVANSSGSPVVASFTALASRRRHHDPSRLHPPATISFRSFTLAVMRGASWFLQAR